MTDIKIYPQDWADMCTRRSGEPYQPSNGTEGECFINSWCGECQRDKSIREGSPIEECDENELCAIIALSFAYSPGDEKYPKEWQYGKDGQPCCTAYVPVGDVIPPPPDTLTGDLFEAIQD